MVEQFNSLLASAASLGCSDIFLSPDVPVMVNLNGDHVDAKSINLDNSDILFSKTDVNEILSKIGTRASQDNIKSRDLDYRYTIKSNEKKVLSFRVSGVSTVSKFQENDIEITFRTFPDSVPSVQQLGIPQQIINCVTNKKYGMFLISGATGSGKTTSLASLLDYVAKNTSKRIITYEAPVEFVHKHAQIRQTEVYRQLIDFKRAVRNSLRRAPHIIMYGEIRDSETIESAVNVCQTGHFVLSTTHTNSVEATIPRLVDEFDSSKKLSTTMSLITNVEGIVHQRLVKARNGGRVALFSYLIFNDSIRDEIRAKMLSKDLQIVLSDICKREGETIASYAEKVFLQGDITITTLISECDFISSEKCLVNYLRSLREKCMQKKEAYEEALVEIHNELEKYDE